MRQSQANQRRAVKTLTARFKGARPDFPCRLPEVLTREKGQNPGAATIGSCRSPFLAGSSPGGGWGKRGISVSEDQGRVATVGYTLLASGRPGRYRQCRLLG